MFEQINACVNGDIKDKDECDIIFLNAGLMAEMEAINLYRTIASKTNNKKIKKTMLDITDEERVHIGEFKELLHQLYPKTKKLEKKGKEELFEATFLKRI